MGHGLDGGWDDWYSLKQLSAASCFLHVDCENAAWSRVCVSMGESEVSLIDDGQEEYLAPSEPLAKWIVRSIYLSMIV